PEGTAGKQWAVVFNARAEEIARFLIPLGAEVRGISEQGIFVENVNIDFISIENELLFYPFTSLNQPETLSFDQATPTPRERNFYVLNGNLLFTADSPVTGREWYVAIPGSGAVTPLVDINPGAAYGTNFTFGHPLRDDLLMFTANDGSNGAEPWITDGTTENTRMIADINPNQGSSNPSQVFVQDSVAYFDANGPDGYELYRMSLRNLQPELIIDLNPGPGDGHPFDFTLIEDNFYFLGREAAGATIELYRIAYDLVPTEAAPTVRPAKLYPNPADNLPLTLEAPSDEVLERLEVFSPSGQLLIAKSISGPTARLDLSTLPSGQYWVRTWYASGRFSINGVSKVR
ncbi:MAG: T9SS type A sorting domain-containing protein, partial [Bacteroidota bacterium]